MSINLILPMFVCTAFSLNPAEARLTPHSSVQHPIRSVEFFCTIQSCNNVDYLSTSIDDGCLDTIEWLASLGYMELCGHE